MKSLFVNIILCVVVLGTFLLIPSAYAGSKRPKVSHRARVHRGHRPPSFTADSPPGQCSLRRKPALFRDNQATFAARHHISLPELRHLNGLSVDEPLRHRHNYVVAQGEIGERLVSGESLGPSNAALIVVDPSRAWGQPHVVAALRNAAAQVQTVAPGPRLAVEDISMPKGGCMAPHREHRGGLEVDAGLFHHQEYKHLHAGTAGSMDVRREWLFLRAIENTHHLRKVLLDRRLIGRLRSHAQKLGEPAQVIRAWFGRGGLFRPAAGHDNHTHLQFHCPKAGCGRPAQVDLPEATTAEAAPAQTGAKLAKP